MQPTRPPIAAIGFFVVAVLSLVMVAIWPAPERIRTNADYPNVVLITVDSLRADHLPVYGYNLNTAPNLRTLAHTGAVFEQAMAPRALTNPSLASLMTSLYPVRHGVRTDAQDPPRNTLNLAGILKRNGFACAAFVANTTGANRGGFDRFERGLRGPETNAVQADVAVTDMTLEWIRNNHKKPFFLWMHYMAPAAPYAPPLEFGKRLLPDYKADIDHEVQVASLEDITLAQSGVPKETLEEIVGLYNGEIAFADSQIKRVIDLLEQWRLREETLVVLTADHGTDLGQHNGYFFHEASIYDSSLHVPLMFSLPGTVPGELRIKNVVETIDVAPTILDLLGIRIPRAFQGLSLTPAFQGVDLNTGDAYSEWDDKVLSVRSKDYRYVLNPLNHHPTWISEDRLADREGETRYIINKEELFDIAADPQEQANIASERPDIVDQLKKQLLGWKRRNRWTAEPDPGQVLDTEVVSSF